MSDEVCPECMGRCCRDDYGYPLAHLNWDVGEHWCEHCTDGTKYVAPNGLYLLTQTKERGYDTYNACVVVATSKTSAQFTHPRHDYAWDGRRWLMRDTVPVFSSMGGWCHPDHVEVTYLGVADSNLKLGVVCASYNAG
jgi:hypothetical protein